MLIDDGVIVTGQGDWQAVPQRLVSARVPDTLTGVLQARLDALAPHEKLALQHASVIGPTFRDDTLARLAPQALDALPALLRRDLIQARDPVKTGAREYTFKHHLLHQVTYDGVLKRDKRALHAELAQWLIQRDPHAGTDLAQIAEHLERAGQTDAAATHWQRAAEDALARDAREAALAHAQRALALLRDAQLEQRFAMVQVRDRVYTRQFDRAARLANLDDADRLAEQLGASQQRDTALWRASYLESGGEFEPALEVAKQALARAEGASALDRAKAQVRVMSPLVRLGRYAAAAALGHEALAVARATGNAVLEVQLLNLIGLIAAEQGDPIGARGCYEQGLVLKRSLGNPLEEARAVGNLAEVARMIGDYDSARAGFAEQVRVCKDIGDCWLEAIAEMNLGLVRLNQGETLAAQEHARFAVHAFQAMGERWGEACARVNVGHVELALGRNADAATQFQAARERFAELGVRHLEVEAVSGLARAALVAGDLATAREHVEFILSRLAAGATLDGLDEPLRVRLTCYQVLAAAADPRAPAQLAQAHAELQAMAGRITDPRLRAGLLHNVPFHREIVAAWQTRPVGLE